MKTRHVKFTIDHVTFADKVYRKNEVAELPFDRADVLIRRGHAEAVDEKSLEKLERAGKIKTATKDHDTADRS